MYFPTKSGPATKKLTFVKNEPLYSVAINAYRWYVGYIFNYRTLELRYKNVGSKVNVALYLFFLGDDLQYIFYWSMHETRHDNVTPKGVVTPKLSSLIDNQSGILFKLFFKACNENEASKGYIAPKLFSVV